MASGAGLNRVGARGGKLLVQCTGDGTYDSGIVMPEAIGFTKWLFQFVKLGTTSVTGWSVTIYGTIDPAAYDLNDQYLQGGWTTNPLTQLPTTSWVPIPAPSTEDTAPDAYAWANPLTATTSALYTNAPWVAVRAVAVGSGSAGAISVYGFAVP